MLSRETTACPASSRLKPVRRPSLSRSGTGCPASVPTPTVCTTTPASLAFAAASSIWPSRSSPSETRTITLFRRSWSTKRLRPRARPAPNELPGEGTTPGSKVSRKRPRASASRVKRHEGIGLAFEGDEAEAVAGKAGHQGSEGLAGEEEPVGGHVLRGHGARGVEDEHDVHTLALHLLPDDPPLRTGEGEDEAGSRHEQQGEAHEAPRLRRPAHDARPERPGHEQGRARAVPPRAEGLESRRQRQQQQAEKPPGRGEDHARLTRGPP